MSLAVGIGLRAAVAVLNLLACPWSCSAITFCTVGVAVVLLVVDAAFGPGCCWLCVFSMDRAGFAPVFRLGFPSRYALALQPVSVGDVSIANGSVDRFTYHSQTLPLQLPLCLCWLS